MAAATSALRIRLEGRLETLEAGLARYRLARTLTRESLEQIIAHEDELAGATEKAKRLPEAGPYLAAVDRHREALRQRLRQRLRALGAQDTPRSLVEEINGVLVRMLPATRRPPAARFEIKARTSSFPSLAAVVLSALLLWLHPMLGLAAGVAIAAKLISELGELDVFADRVRLRRMFRAPLELPPSFVRFTVAAKTVHSPFGALELATTEEADQVATSFELLQHAAFQGIGELSSDSIWFARSARAAGAALVARNGALFIPDGAWAYNLVVGGTHRWTRPRAWLLVHLICRLPPDDREKALSALTGAGCATEMSLQTLEAEFELRY